MEWIYKPNQRLFYRSSPEGEYSVQIDGKGIWISMDYEDNDKSVLEMGGIQRKTGTVIAETVIVDKNGLKVKRKQISRLLHNKDKIKEIPNKKVRDLAQLVLIEAEKLN